MPAAGPDGAEEPVICPLLRRDFGGAFLQPAPVPGMEHVCTAGGVPRVQSLQQQDLVCLRPAHVDCPRYVAAAASRATSRVIPTIPRATAAALLILVLSAGVSFAFVVQRGGIAMPVVGESPTSVAAVASTPGTPEPATTDAPATAAQVPSPTPAATATADPLPAVTPAPSPTPSPASTPTPAVVPTAKPTPQPTPRPTATPKSDRYALLKPCPDRKNCYVYVVRSGDNLFSIARYFGHPLSTIYSWNPQYPETRLRKGDQIRMPPPAR